MQSSAKLLRLALVALFMLTVQSSFAQEAKPTGTSLNIPTTYKGQAAMVVTGKAIIEATEANEIVVAVNSPENGMLFYLETTGFDEQTEAILKAVSGQKVECVYFDGFLIVNLVKQQAYLMMHVKGRDIEGFKKEITQGITKRLAKVWDGYGLNKVPLTKKVKGGFTSKVASVQELF